MSCSARSAADAPSAAAAVGPEHRWRVLRVYSCESGGNLETMPTADPVLLGISSPRPASRHMSWCCEAAAVLSNVYGGPCPVFDCAAGAAPPPPANRLSLAEANAISETDFRRIFGNVVECCPDAAATLAASRPFAGVDEAAARVGAFLDDLPEGGRARVLLLHPELAGRLAQRGLLTAESQREQQAAGVLRLPRDQADRLAALTTRYRERFGFPYVVCVREKSALEIFSDLECRLGNPSKDELCVGIDEVKKICRLRIRELIASDE